MVYVSTKRKNSKLHDERLHLKYDVASPFMMKSFSFGSLHCSFFPTTFNHLREDCGQIDAEILTFKTTKEIIFKT